MARFQGKLVKLFRSVVDAEEQIPEPLQPLLKPSVRGHIVQVILGHRANAPSFGELKYYSPSTDPEELRSHLDELSERGYLTKIDAPDEPDDVRVSPDMFFTLTPRAYEILGRYKVFVTKLDEIYADYESVERSDRVQQLESFPRPTSRATVYFDSNDS